jgi:hypothetical protein
MSRRSRLHYTLTTIGYGASRIKARLPRSRCLLGDSLSFGAAVRYELPSHTTSRQNQPSRPRSLVSVRATAFRSWLPPIGPIKDFHLQSLRHARRNSGRCSANAPSVPPPDGFAPSPVTASGETPDGLRARRKPTVPVRPAGPIE